MLYSVLSEVCHSARYHGGGGCSPESAGFPWSRESVLGTGRAGGRGQGRKGVCQNLDCLYISLSEIRRFSRPPTSPPQGRENLNSFWIVLEGEERSWAWPHHVVWSGVTLTLDSLWTPYIRSRETRSSAFPAIPPPGFGRAPRPALFPPSRQAVKSR